ncbi:MAG: hypothetical protein AAF580_10445 [Pseudomonadota bacterium]
MRAAVVLLLTLLVAGCAENVRVFGIYKIGYDQPIQLRNKMTAAELRPYAGNGSSFIVGQALRRHENGTVVTCAGEVVYIMPAVPLVDEAIEIWKHDNRIYEHNLERPHVTGAVRYSHCDAAGRFYFNGLPALNYWVLAPVPVGWGNVDMNWDYRDKPDVAGSYLVRKVYLSEGQGIRLILSHRWDDKILQAEPWKLVDKIGPKHVERIEGDQFIVQVLPEMTVK